MTLQARYLAIVDEIERTCDVAHWKAGDVDLWPPARMDLFLDMFRAGGGETQAPALPLPLRAMISLATPVTNLWKSRHDLAHWIARPRRADAILLGDGVSLDHVEGAWRDRYGDPLVDALGRRGQSLFLMQPGNLARLPWRRPTFAANRIAVRGALLAALRPVAPLEVPDHTAVIAILARHGIIAPSLSPTRLARRARTLAATATAFQRVLRRVRPRFAFVVTYYAGLGHAFALACRREAILCVDLQHCPQYGTHKAYGWHRPPARGYSTLPSLFWTWTAGDAASIRRWTDTLTRPWHRSLHGGHTQLAAFLDDDDPAIRAWDARFAAIGGGQRYDREILVALQPIGGRRAQWQALAHAIEAAPDTWRWWIRRHPSATPAQDTEYASLLGLHRPNVIIAEAGQLPLPALLRHMSVLVSLASGAAGEAAALGVPALFLDAEARGPFAGLLAAGHARVVDVTGIATEIARMDAAPTRARADRAPPTDETLQMLEAIAAEYRRLCGGGSARSQALA
jgi:hypothetical protein